MNYSAKINLRQQFIAAQQVAMQRAEQGLIPTGGYMTKCDLYVPGKTPDSAPKRVTIPSEAIQWLLKQMESPPLGLRHLLTCPAELRPEIASKSKSDERDGAFST